MEPVLERDVETVRTALARFFRRRAGEDAEDLVQQTMLLAVEATQPLRDPGTGRAYLFAIARRVLAAHFRRLQRAPLTEPPHTEAADPGGPGVDEELRTLTRLSVERLPPPVRHVMRLAYWDGMSRSEIAGSLGVPAGTVASRLRTGLHLLRQEHGKGPKP